MKTSLRLVSLLMCAALLLPACAAAEGSEGVCYRVSGGKNELFLLGTIHIGNESMYPVGEHILSALEKADTLVMECDTESAAPLAQMATMMRYPDDDALKAHLSEETYTLLSMVCERKGYPLEMLDTLRPWAVVSMFALEATAAELGAIDVTAASELGVERQVGLLAGDKPRAYLETAESQLNVMDNFSAALQDYMLKSTLNTILDPEMYASPGDADIALWPDWWARGDADSFAQSYLASLESDPEQELIREYHEGLVTNRNRIMADGLRTLMEGDERHSYFAMIGLLHLALPDDSVVKLLGDMGYQVERVYQ